VAKISPINITNLSSVQQLVQFINPFFGQLTTALNNGLSFQDNIRATTKVVYFPTANQNVQVAHQLNATPIGYLAIRTSAACSIYDGISTVLGATYVNMKCNTSGITATILFF